FGSNTTNACNGCISGSAAGSCNRNGAVIRNVNLGAGLFHQGADHLATWSNNIANLFGVDLNLDNSGSVRRNFRTRFSQGLRHDAQNVQPSLLGLFESFSHDLRINATDLD